MQLEHEFSVPVPAAQAWPVLLDIERIAPCMPGATVTKVEGDDFEGTVKVKVGPITVTYGGSASFLEKDETDRRAVIEARGRETRGTGTASARITAQLFGEGDSTRVKVSTDLSVTGKPAQFGRGVMSDVGGKLLGRFADCLAGQLAGTPAPAPAPAAAVPASAEATPAAVPASVEAAAAVPASVEAAPAATAEPSREDAATSPAREAPASVLDAAPAQPRREVEAIDLMEAAGGAVAKRVVPLVGALALLAVLIAVLRRRR